MDYVSIFLLIAGLLCSFVFAFVVYQLVRFGFDWLNVWREENDKKPFNNWLVVFLSLASAFSFIL